MKENLGTKKMKASAHIGEVMFELRAFKKIRPEKINFLEIALHQKVVEFESKVSLENIKKMITENYNEDFLVWWDKIQLKANLKIKEDKKYEFFRCEYIPMNIIDQKDI